MATIFDASRDGLLPDADIDVLAVSIDVVLDAAEYQIATEGTPNPDMTVDLLAALKLYTAAIEPEETGLYYLVNKALRSEDRSVVKPFTGIIWLIMKGLKSLPAIEDTVIFRGVKKNLSGQYIKGTKVTWSAFSSCTSTLEVLSNPMFLGPSGDRTFFMITHTSKRARDISRISLVPGEDEIILPPNSRFDVVSVLVSADGRVDVHLKEITPLDPIMTFPVTPTSKDRDVAQAVDEAVARERQLALERERQLQEAVEAAAARERQQALERERQLQEAVQQATARERQLALEREKVAQEEADSRMASLLQSMELQESNRRQHAPTPAPNSLSQVRILLS